MKFFARKFFDKKLLVILFLVIATSLLVGSNVIHFLIWYLLYFLIKTLFLSARLILNKFSDATVFFTKTAKGVFVVLLIIGCGKAQIYYGRWSFKKDVKVLEEYKKRKGSYPLSLENAGVNGNPYLSLLGPEYSYFYNPDLKSTTEPNFCLIEMSPFGRRCYDFKKGEELYVD